MQRYRGQTRWLGVMMGQHVVSTRYLGQSIHTYVLLKPEWNTLVEGIIRNEGPLGNG